MLRSRLLISPAAFIVLAFGSIFAQTTEFTYQGSLKDGANPANGNYDFQFGIYTAVTGGAQIGSTVSVGNVAVANGSFTVSLDFGNQFPGSDRYLEIRVRPAGSGSYTTLTPRPKLLSSPHAIRSLSTGTADNSDKFGGLLPDQYVLTGDIRLSDARPPLPGSNSYIQNSSSGQTASMNITGTAQISGANSSAAVTVSNSQPGISNPSPDTLPPAALKAEATSTSDSNVGLLGIGNGSTGIGVIGITKGSGVVGGQADAIGVIALATSTTGKATALVAQNASPNGAAIEAQTSATGLLFSGESDNNTSPNPKIIINALGQVVANGSVFAKGFQLNSGNFGVTQDGVVSAYIVETVNNMRVGGTLSGGTDTLQLGNNLYVPGTVTINGTITPGMLGGGNTTICTLTGTTTLRFCSSSLRYKKDIRPYVSGLDLVKRFHPVKFAWQENGDVDFGLVAEDVAKIDPLMVTYNKSGQVEGVKYDHVGVVLINAVKEQQAQIEAQQKEIDGGKLVITKQQAEIDLLKAYLCKKSPKAKFCRSHK